MFERWGAHPSLPGVAVRYRDGYANDDTFGREMVQDIEPGIDAATRERNETQGWNTGRTARKAASIPAIVYYDWVAEWERQGLLTIGDPEFERKANDLCLKRVRDSDFSKFKV